MSSLAAEVQRRTPVEVSLSRFFLSLVLALTGCALCLAAVFLWFAQASHGMPEVSLTKLWMSVLLFAAGTTLVMKARH